VPVLEGHQARAAILRDVSVLPRLLVIIGSGEMAAQMSRVHRSVMRRLAAARGDGAAVRGAVVDTPYGFQENAAAISADALDYFGRRLGLDVSLASLPRSDGDILAREAAYAAIREADFVFSGPGSPSYALSQWSETEVPTLFADKLVSGGALVVASAAALTLGVFTAPIYEVYKAGEDPYWLPGLDILAAIGINAVVIPHWDNAEGTGHDTRYCFLGRRRLEILESRLPTDVFLLGIDEHTALVVDLDAHHATVRGRGSVTVRRQGAEMTFSTGSDFPLDNFRTAIRRLAQPKAPDAQATGESNLARRLLALEAATAELRTRADLVDPLIEELLRLRNAARAAADYATADAIRALLAGLEIELRDSADGATSYRVPTRRRPGATRS
jgi:cyanophycinase-like exopeptidase